MVISVNPTQIRERLDAYQRERQRRLLLRARALKMHIDPDHLTGGNAVRSPYRHGYVEIVTDTGCTCEEYESLGSCPHSALVAAECERRAVA